MTTISTHSPNLDEHGNLRPLTPKEIMMQERRIDILRQEMNFLSVEEYAENLYIVTNQKSDHRYEVDMDELTCTCSDFEKVLQNSLTSCKHIVLVAWMLRDIALEEAAVKEVVPEETPST